MIAQAQDIAGEKALHSFWRKLAVQLELQPDQRMRIAELRDVFLAKTARTQRRRSAAAQQLAEALPQGDFYHQGGFRYVKAAEALELLQQTLRDQHIYDLQVRVEGWMPLCPLGGLRTYRKALYLTVNLGCAALSHTIYIKVWIPHHKKHCTVGAMNESMCCSG